MIDIQKMRVIKKGRTICSVPELQVAAGIRLSILGPNGSGKTTLMRALAGLETDYVGRLQVNAARRDRVYVHQSPFMFRGTVLFNVIYGMRQRGTAMAQCERLARQWLKRLGIEHLIGHRAMHLSGGERRRVALARALILQPRILLLDEPFSDLDEDGATAVCAALNGLAECTILFASPTPLRDGLSNREFRLERDDNLESTSQ